MYVRDNARYIYISNAINNVNIISYYIDDRKRKQKHKINII